MREISASKVSLPITIEKPVVQKNVYIFDLNLQKKILYILISKFNVLSKNVYIYGRIRTGVGVKRCFSTDGRFFRQNPEKLLSLISRVLEQKSKEIKKHC